MRNLALVAITLAITAPAAAAAQDEGGTPVVADPGLARGQWSERVSLDLPPAARDVRPSLALVASHTVRDGEVGAGWQLTGGSVIRRRAASGAVPALDGSMLASLFLVDGEPLVAVTTPGVAHYQPRTFDGSRFDYSAASDTWTRKRAGWTWTYGDLAAKATRRIVDVAPFPGCAAPCNTESWYLRSVVDPFGNRIDFTYRTEAVPAPFAATYPTLASNRDHVLSTITYAASNATVTFSYATRPDPRVDLSAGFPVLHTHRLDQVVATTGTGTATQEYSRYRFQYVDQTGSDTIYGTRTDCDNRQATAMAAPVRTLLRKVHRTAGTTGAGRVVRCNVHHVEDTAWGGGLGVSTTVANPFGPYAAIEPLTDSWLPMPAELDGDGRTDLLVLAWRPGDLIPHKHRAYVATPYRTTPFADAAAGGQAGIVASAWEGHINWAFDATTGARALTDVDGDAIPELVFEENGALQIDRAVSLFDAAGALTGVSFVPMTQALDRCDARYGQFVDVDGDRRVDVVVRPHAADDDCGAAPSSRWIRNLGQAPWFDSAADLALRVPLERSTPPAGWTAALAACPGGAVSWPTDVRDTWDATRYVGEQARFDDWNDDGLIDVAYALYGCWSEGTRWAPYQASIYSAIHFGDGKGNFVESGLPAGPPVLLDAAQWGGTGDTRITSGTLAALDVDRDGWSELLGTTLSSGGARFGIGVRPNHDHAPAAAPLPPFYVPPPDGFSVLPTALIAPAPLVEDAVGSAWDCDPVSRQATWGDFDGDGFLDVLTLEGSAPGATSGWIAEVRYSTRTTAQGRMVASDGEHGGRTTLRWGFTAAPPNQNPDLPINLEVLQSVGGPSGNHTMIYERATLAGGEVTPFAQVAVAGDRGAVEVYAFITAPWGRGAQHVGARYREDGSLEHVSVQEHGYRNGATAYVDVAVPYFDPLVRRCEFDLGYDSILIETAVSDCRAATWRAPYVGQTAGAASQKYAVDDATYRIAIGHDRSPAAAWTNLFGQVWGVGATPRPGVGAAPYDTAFARAVGAIADPSGGAFFRWPVPAALAAALPDVAAAEAGYQHPTPLVEDRRAFAWDWSYDHGLRRLERTYAHRHLATVADDLSVDLTWTQPDATGYWYRLTTERTDDHTGTRLTQVERSSWAGFDDARTVKRCGRASPTDCTTDTSTLFANGTLKSHTLPDGTVEAWTRLAWCGAPLTHTDPAGLVTTFERTTGGEKRCLLTKLTRDGAITTTTYDAFARPLTVVTTPGGGAPASATVRRTYFYDDAWSFDATAGAREDASYAEPRQAVLRGDGRLEYSYADGLGRTTRVTQCTNTGTGAPAGDITKVACGASTKRHLGWTLYGSDGLAKLEAAPFENGATPVTTGYAHDHLGRPVVLMVPADQVGAPSWWSHTLHYGAGYEERVSPTATGTATTRITHGTLGTTVKVGAVVRSTSSYDALGNLIAVTEPDGTGTRLEYDDRFRLSREVRVDAAGAVLREQVVDDGGAAVSLPYEHVILARDGRGRVTEELMPDGTVAAVTYDALDRVATRTLDGVLVETRRYQQPTTTTRGRIAVTDELGGSEVVDEIDGLGRTWARTAPRTSRGWTYDEAGRVATQIDDAGRAARLDYDRRDDLLAITTPATGTTQFAYDELGRLASRTDADGASETFAYTYAGSLARHRRGSIEISARTYDPRGQVVEATEGGVPMAYEYDALGRLTRHREGVDGAAELRVTSYAYDAGDRVTEVRRAPVAGMQIGSTMHTYDAWGRLATTTDARGGVTRFRRDLAGRVRRMRDPADVELETRYDAFGRVVAQQRAAGGWGYVTYAGRATFETEPNLWLITTQDSEDVARAVSTRRYVDGAGHPIAELYPDGTSRRWTWSAGEVTREEVRAADGSVHRATDHVFDATTGRRQTTTTGPYQVGYEFTAAGRPWRITTPDDVLERTYQGGLLATYREAGVGHRLIRGAQTGWVDREEISASGATRTRDFARDLLGRPLRIDTNDGSKPAVTVRFAGYDYFDQPALETRTIGGLDVVEARGFDALGRITARTTSGTGLPARTTSWSWLSHGELGAVTTPAGVTLSYDYGTPLDHQLDVVRTGNTTLARIDARDARGAITALTLPTLGQTRSFGYDDRGRLEVSTTAALPPTPSFETARTFFPDGKLATETVTDLVSSTAWTSEYAYDGAGRLTEELVGKTGARHVYTLDAAGNRLSTTTTDALGAVTTAMTATYAGPRLTEVSGTALTYDAWNDVTADHHGNQYARNADGALAVLSRGGVGVALSRNARGEPIAEIEGFGVRRSTWDLAPGLPLEIEDATGAALTYLNVEGHHLGVLANGTLTPVEADDRGTVLQHGAQLLGDAAATGTGLVAPTGLDDRFTFAMLERVPAARKVMLARVRTYDPVTGRFLERDPIGAAGGLELYQYGYGDPVNHLDPWGDTAIGADCAAGATPNFGFEPLKPRLYDTDVSQIPQSLDQQMGIQSLLDSVNASREAESHARALQEWLGHLKKSRGGPWLPPPPTGTQCIANCMHTPTSGPSEPLPPIEPPAAPPKGGGPLQGLFESLRELFGDADDGVVDEVGRVIGRVEEVIPGSRQRHTLLRAGGRRLEETATRVGNTLRELPSQLQTQAEQFVDEAWNDPVGTALYYSPPAAAVREARDLATDVVTGVGDQVNGAYGVWDASYRMMTADSDAEMEAAAEDLLDGAGRYAGGGSKLAPLALGPLGRGGGRGTQKVFEELLERAHRLPGSTQRPSTISHRIEVALRPGSTPPAVDDGYAAIREDLDRLGDRFQRETSSGKVGDVAYKGREIRRIAGRERLLTREELADLDSYTQSTEELLDLRHLRDELGIERAVWTDARDGALTQKDYNAFQSVVDEYSSVLPAHDRRMEELGDQVRALDRRLLDRLRMRD